MFSSRLTWKGNQIMNRSMKHTKLWSWWLHGAPIWPTKYVESERQEKETNTFLTYTLHIWTGTWDHLNIKCRLCSIGTPHFKDKMVWRPSHLYNVNPHTQKDCRYIEAGPCFSCIYNHWQVICGNRNDNIINFTAKPRTITSHWVVSFCSLSNTVAIQAHTTSSHCHHSCQPQLLLHYA